MKIYYTNQFKKDYKRIKKQNKDIAKLRIVVEKLVAKKPLEAKYSDHPLSGNWKGFRDCRLVLYLLLKPFEKAPNALKKPSPFSFVSAPKCRAGF